MTPHTRIALLIASLAAPSIALALAPTETAVAWLSAMTFLAAIPLGGAALLMVGFLTHGRWFEAIRPRLECFALCAPIVAILAAPLFLAAGALYPWDHTHESITGASIYYAPWFAGARAVVILLIWSIGGPALALASSSLRAGEHPSRPLRAASAAGLIVLVLTTTIGFQDWVAFLEPGWHSSIFGVLIVCFHALAALAAATGLHAASPRNISNSDRDMLSDLGALMLMQILLHAYMMFSQFFIIWNGNLPERTSWYDRRTGTLWVSLLVIVTLCAFAAPFVMLLFSAVKRARPCMCMLSAGIVFGAACEAAWLVIPSAPGNGSISLVLYSLLTACALGLAASLVAPGGYSWRPA